jgi:hypothetical protein
MVARLSISPMQPFNAPEPPWLDRRLFPFESRYVELNGNRIHYIDQGEGPTLLFLHPSPAPRHGARCSAILAPHVGGNRSCLN